MRDSLDTFSKSDFIIGAVFTPREGAEFVIKEFGIFDDWIAGATIFDPTMGCGNLLASLVDYGLEQGYVNLPIENLYGNELNANFYDMAVKRFSEKYSVNMKNNFFHGDIFDFSSRRFDIIFGNPPWLNFTELPNVYKEEIKKQFLNYDLVKNKKSLLMGASRMDIASLVIKKSIKDFLYEGKSAYFFLPLSLFFNDGAHEGFRNYTVGNTNFAVSKIIDFKEMVVFENISTRYGVAAFHRDNTTQFPIPYFSFENGKWQEHSAEPLFKETDPLSIMTTDLAKQKKMFKPIYINKYSQPRQGINPCGASSLFFFDSYQQIDENTCLVLNTYIETILPIKFIHPLLISKNFRNNEDSPQKWVFLPYKTSGQPMSEYELKENKLVWNYLCKHKKTLQSRKGKIINSWIKRGYWWAMLGIGSYSFMPYKIVWESYGRKSFNPQIFSGNWQVNQSLQAFIPTKTRDEAIRLLKALDNAFIENYLRSLNMEGTMNWAQPGKIKKLLVIQNDEELFD